MNRVARHDDIFTRREFSKRSTGNDETLRLYRIQVHSFLICRCNCFGVLAYKCLPLDTRLGLNIRYNKPLALGHLVIRMNIRAMATDLDANANDMEGVSGTMRAEEERMRTASRKQEEQRASKLEKEREADIKGGKDGVDTKFKALEFLLSQSKVSRRVKCSRVWLEIKMLWLTRE